MLFTVIITKSHLVCTYNDNLVTLVHFAKSKMHIFDKISKLEPKLITTDLFISNGRRLDKKIQVNKSANLVNYSWMIFFFNNTISRKFSNHSIRNDMSLQILIWRKSTMNEVYPWSPTMKQYHRANMHLFRLTGYVI